MKAEIICIGTELLLGNIINTNAAYISRKLAALGIDIYYQTTVGDNPQRLNQSVWKAIERSDIVVLTGGLGPTVDDITIGSVSKLVGSKLVLNRAILRDIKEHFRSRGIAMPAGNERQAYIPEGARWLPNTVGTAPGIIIEFRERVIVCLPGPPREMHPIMERGVLPYFERKFKSDSVFLTRTLKTTGRPESQVNLMVKDLLKLAPPTTVGIYAKLGQVDLTIMAKAKSDTEANRAIAPIEKKIRARLKDNIFGYDDDTLESAVGKALAKKKLTISVAESCTGGLVSNRITDVSGSSDYFTTGVVAYSNNSKENYLGVRRETLTRYGAVSKQVAHEMARGIKHFACTDVGLALTGIAGPTGPSTSLGASGTKKKPVGLVYIALATDKKCIAREFRFKGSRQDIKYQASQAALNMVRLCAHS